MELSDEMLTEISYVQISQYRTKVMKALDGEVKIPSNMEPCSRRKGGNHAGKGCKHHPGRTVEAGCKRAGHRTCEKSDGLCQREIQ